MFVRRNAISTDERYVENTTLFEKKNLFWIFQTMGKFSKKKLRVCLAVIKPKNNTTTCYIFLSRVFLIFYDPSADWTKTRLIRPHPIRRSEECRPRKPWLRRRYIRRFPPAPGWPGLMFQSGIESGRNFIDICSKNVSSFNGF